MESQSEKKTRCLVCGKEHPKGESTLVAGVQEGQDPPQHAGDRCLRELLTSEDREQIYVGTCSTGKGSSYAMHWAKGFSVTQVLSHLRYTSGAQRAQLREMKVIILPRGAYGVRVSPHGEVYWRGGGGLPAQEVEA